VKLPIFNRTFKQSDRSFRQEIRFHIAEGWGVEEIAMAAEVSTDEIRAHVKAMRNAGELGNLQ
jgi:DNA-directed RNA polymerase specialized sigma24 family protein